MSPACGMSESLRWDLIVLLAPAARMPRPHRGSVARVRRTMSICYTADERPDAGTIAALYTAAPLRRPVDDLDRIARMYAGSPIVLSAWDGPRLIGILRGWSDGAYDGYVCDRAVRRVYQQQVLGRERLDRGVARSARERWVARASAIGTDD